MKRIIIATLIITTILLTGCSKTQIGWASTNVGDTFQASYRRFDGQEIETYQLESGESFTLSYNIEVEEGSLTLEMFDPEDNLVWENTFSEDAQDSFAFTPETDGRYELRVIGDETQGSFELNW